MENVEITQKLKIEIEKTEKIIKEYTDIIHSEFQDVEEKPSLMDPVSTDKIALTTALDHAKIRLNRLDLVLSNVGHPDFGICKNCHNPIPIARILVRPESIYCVNCAK